MVVSREMTFIECEVYNLILNEGTFENPLHSNFILKETGLSKRGLKDTVESLRVNFGHPIVAKKSKPYGYFLPMNEEERQSGTAPYRRQILTEQKNLAAVMAVDLDDYWKSA